MNFSAKKATYSTKRVKPQTGIADTLLISRITRKDKEALKQLFETYHKRIFRFAYKMLNDYEAASDITSEVFVAVWEKAGSFKGKSAPSTWIFGIAHNKIRSFFRKKKYFNELDDTNLAEDSMDSLHKHQDLKLALNILSAEHREVLEMIFFLGLTYEEAAELIGCPLGTVKSRVFHAKKMLEQFLSSEKRRPNHESLSN